MQSAKKPSGVCVSAFVLWRGVNYWSKANKLIMNYNYRAIKRLTHLNKTSLSKAVKL